MGKHLFLALSRPSQGREEEFHAWYDACHLGDVVTHCPGFISGQRYFAANRAQAPKARPSLAIYLLDSDDLEALHRNAADSVGRFTPSNGVFAPDHAAWVYSAQPLEEAELERWIMSEERGAITLLFFDDANAASGAAEFDNVDSSPVLARAAGQRIGEWPEWPYLMLVRASAGQDVTAGIRAAAAWTYQPRGVRVTPATHA